MNAMERAALKHAAEWRRYDRSPQAQIDRLVSAARRAQADRKAGHTPHCSLTKCASNCPSARGAV